MVVLEGGGMLTSSGNQYLQPDYLSPLPTTLDAKKSPLALLAQTCSQIGADSPTAKPLISTLDKPSKKTASSNNGDNVPRSSPTVSAKASNNATDKVSRATPTENKSVAFKPYENTVTSKKSGGDERPTSKSSSAVVINVDNFGCDEKKPESRCSTTSSSRKSVSSPSMATGGSTTPAPTDIGKSSPSDNRKSTSPTTSSSTRGASPIIRSGLEILQGHPKDLPLGAYKSNMSSLGGLSGPLSSLCCPPGLEHANPAFRPPFPGGPFSHHHHHAAAAAAMLAAGYPPSAPSPYVSYARVKTPSGGEALVPVCKDPYCTGCQFSVHNQQLLMGAANPTGSCPSGCTQCDHQKYGLAMAMSMVPPGALPPPHPSSLGYAPHQLGSPYVCNWIAGESYCGKRFRTSEELLQHLRTHTSIAGAADAAAAAAAAAVATSTPGSLLTHPHSLFSQAVLHRAAAAAYPNPPLSPLSAARYHPYTKPGLPSSLGASPYSAFNPAPLTSPYYSPYSLYGQRLGAAVHP